jgi:mono/diheme cytochrome c family protein
MMLPGLPPLANLGAAALIALSFMSAPARAQNAAHPVAAPILSPAFKFAETSGAELYANVCQACHMPDGKGAIGAGAYPSLAGNSKLETSAYPVYVVVNGSKGMPPVGAMMNDEQVAAVVNYLRTHFGNSYRDMVTADDAKSARPEK